MSTPFTPLSISEAAATLGVSPDTLRYYEREGLVKVPRQGRVRQYGPAQLERLRFLFVLRGTGMSMAGLREHVALVEQGPVTLPQRREMLVAQERLVQAQHARLDDHLKAVRLKLHRYDTECGHIQPASKPETRSVSGDTATGCRKEKIYDYTP